MSEVYTPSANDRLMAQIRYIDYAIGSTVLHDPQSVQRTFQRVFDQAIPLEQPEQVVRYGRNLMVHGLRAVISYAHPMERRDRLNDLKDGFTEAVPHLAATVNDAYEQSSFLLNLLNPELLETRPAPVLDPEIYRRLCQLRFEWLKSGEAMEKLMGGIAIAEPLQKAMFEHNQLAKAG